MIYCVWYPSGGFGHFINAILSLHGENFAQPLDKKIKFSSTGDSHSVDLVAPKYFRNPTNYQFNFDSSYNYSVLIDNGINNEDQKFLDVFPNAQIIKLCYSDYSWPIVANTLIQKAMNSEISKELIIDKQYWLEESNWAVREKYFLFLRDHPLRNAWRPSEFSQNLFVEDLEYINLKKFLNSIKIKTSNFYNEWLEWNHHNQKYFSPVETAKQIINSLEQNIIVNLSNITDIWTQAVVYYYIWLRYNVEVPHNTYKHFFSNTLQIRAWLIKEKCV